MTHSIAGKALRVFISYSHDSTAHKTHVGDLATRLRDAGIDVHLDQDTSAPAEGWAQWTKEHIESANVVLCVFTEAYRSRFDRKAPPGEGRGVKWEAKLLQNLLYRDEGKNRRIVPVVFEAADVQHIPLELENDTRYCVTDAADFEDLCRRLGGSAKTPAPTVAPQDSDSTDLPDSVAAYVQWAKQRYDHLDLIGIDAGDVHVPFDEVYVPLKVAHQASRDDMMGFLGGRRETESTDVDLSDVLRREGARHALIFGEPGSGKTTALLKLHHLCMQNPADLGLPEGTVPVFLRLRHFRPELLEQGLKVFIENEIRQLSGDRVGQGIGDALWTQRRLLLLFDGLDELGKSPYRTEVLQRVGWFLGDAEAAQMRAVVTCRRVGLPRYEGRDGVYQAFSVRPFQNEQIEQLVQRWFREHARSKSISSSKAEQRQRTILKALKGPDKANQQILEMVSNPLLLTLLCVVVLQGNEIPKRRVHFFRQCLDVMLDRWPRQRKGGEPCPVDLSLTRTALGRLAFLLHRQKRRDDLEHLEAVVELKDVVGTRRLAKELFRWLHQQAGLIVDYTDQHYGFAHLALQEYLAAYHLNEVPGDLDQMDGDFDEDTWKEVFLQLSALSPAGFTALMSWLIDQAFALEGRSQLLRQCLAEAKPPDLSAFVEVLQHGEASRQEAVLRLLLPVEHRPGNLMDVVRSLAGQGTDEVRRLAESFLAAEAQGSTSSILVLYGPEEDRSKADELQQCLADWRGGHPAVVAQANDCCDDDEACRLVVALLGSSPVGWDRVEMAQRYYDDLPWLVVTLPGDPRPSVPEVFGDCEVFHWQLDEDAKLLQWITEHLARLETVEVLEAPESKSGPAVVTRGAAAEPKVDSQNVLVDSVTGMEFLHVPGGRFVMGSDDLFTEGERDRLKDEYDWFLKAPTPACSVRLSSFWLAKTPVANAQYARFLGATGHEEPETWRERRFSDEAQPVVSISWEDAQAFCRWLTETNPDGHRFQLPSEAQWEFAARGPESWIYPWGNERPEDHHACFGLNWNEDGPAAVGSFQDGVGPFGHLDLAGLVWEWCRDAWEEDHSRLAKLKDSLGPVGEADPGLRPVRGGAWFNPASLLVAAFRHRDRPGLRYTGLGFRVLCVPELDR